jgi:PAS domain S-box-containing protein
VFWHLWGDLEYAIKQGTNRWLQTFDLQGDYWDHIFRTEEAKKDFLMGMHGYGQITSQKLVQAFDLSGYKMLVDLGGGTGHVAIEACKKYPHLKAKVFELEKVVPLTNEIIAAIEDDDIRKRIQVVAGNFFTGEIPKADVYCLARTIHDWPEKSIKRLLKKIFERLPPGGALIIAEKLLNADRSGPNWAQMQNLNMLVLAEGKERTFAQYEALLKDAGFDDVEKWVPDSPLDFIRAVKPGGAKLKDKRLERLLELEVSPIKRPRRPFHEEAELYSAFFEQSKVGLVIAKWDGEFLLVNQAFAKILGQEVPEVRGMNYKHITPKWYAEDDVEQINELETKGFSGPFRKEYIRKNERGEDELVSVRVTLKKILIKGEKCIWASVESVDD